MKTFPPALAAALARPATTLCRAYVATRADGAVFGCTDHDRDLTIAGVLCRAVTGVARSEVVASAGLGVGGSEIAGALSSEAITEADIASGLWDGAEVRTYLVDWRQPEVAAHVATGHLGEVTRRDGAFAAELRSLAAALDQPKGRLYQHRCDAVFGDARCRLDLAARRTSGVVVAVARGRHVVVDGLAGVAARTLNGGTLSYAGRRFAVKADGDGGDDLRALELWEIAEGLAAGAVVTVTPGCDKRFETCRDRFDNALNFRGFPHIPGNDFLIAAPASSSNHDGGALFP